MELKNWKQYAFIFAIIGAVLYILLTSIAMIFYPGGTMANYSTSGYSFFGNYFSDLGRVKSWSGNDNTVSMVFYMLATAIFGISLIPFSLAIQEFFNEEKSEKIISFIGSICGIIAGGATIGFAFTPSDIYLEAHLIFVLIGYLGIFVMSIIYSNVMFKSDYPKPYGRVFVIFAVIFFIGILLNVMGPTFMLKILGQKIHKYATMICFIIQGYGAWKLKKS